MIITSCTTEPSLFEAYSGKTIQAKGFQVISPEEDTLLLGKVEVEQKSSITIQKWIKQQSQDKTIAKIRDILQSKKLSQWKGHIDDSVDMKTMLRHKQQFI